MIKFCEDGEMESLGGPHLVERARARAMDIVKEILARVGSDFTQECSEGAYLRQLFYAELGGTFAGVAISRAIHMGSETYVPRVKAVVDMSVHSVLNGAYPEVKVG